MQNKYVGDVGDFGKYGLLRYLSAQIDAVKIGVNWYLTDDEQNSDGKHTDYLTKKTFRTCDAFLFDHLKTMVEEGDRSVRAVEDCDLIEGATYYTAALRYTGLTRAEHIAQRDSWFSESIRILHDCDLLYLDPDNGLEVKSQSAYGAKGVKYTRYDEVAEYYRLGKSVIVYNHRDRSPMETYVRRFDQLKALMPENSELPVLRFSRYSVRDYAFIIQPNRADVVKDSLAAFIRTGWGQHFSLLTL